MRGQKNMRKRGQMGDGKLFMFEDETWRKGNP